MAYTAVSMPTSPTPSAAIDITKDHNGLRRAHSSKDLCTRSDIRRSYSDNHLCRSINRVQASSVQPKLKRSMGFSPFQFSGTISKDMNMVNIEEKGINIEENVVERNKEEIKNRANWVERLMEIKKHWRNRIPKESMDPNLICNNNTYDDGCDSDEDDNVCVVGYDEEEDEKEVTYDRDSFSKFLAQVPWSETKLYSQLAFLSNMAYVIPEIKAKDLRRYYSLQFITSSLEKKAEVAKLKAKLDQDSTQVPINGSVPSQDGSEKGKGNEQKHQIKLAYDIAASAASYVQLRAKNLLSLAASKSQQQSENVESNGREDLLVEDVEDTSRVYNKSEVAAYVAASTMTSVVAASETERQETANGLQSLHSSPCEWFVCDDPNNYTRCFVIQGSDSMASWQANLFFEPTEFEDTDVLVHRGIYEAAKGIYEQFMPEIMDHLKRHGELAKLQFTGHSLGGSLSLLVHLMLLTRKVVSSSTLRPVVTFGSPFVFCGGQKILDELGLDESHIHCVMMHRDIVPRAFSCNYPNHVAIVLKRLNSSFRSHPCLMKHKLLYTPLGKIFILQPNEKTSPPHPLLPSGSAFYALDNTRYGYSPNVLRAFLNQPHPLETLSDPTAYGSEGTILRDHDSSNYLKAVNGVLRQHSKILVRRIREQRIESLWPLLTSPSPHLWSHEQNLEKCNLMTKEIAGV